MRTLLLSCLLFGVGCGLFDDTELSVTEKANGIWRGVSGDNQVSEGHAIYFYNCYMIAVHESADDASVWWDNGLRWLKTPATVNGDQIRLTVEGVETTFTMHSEEAAMATFVDPVRFENKDSMFTKELAKIHADTSADQNIYSVCHG